MILVASGHRAPFNRLISTLDRWAGQHGDTPVIAQIGDKGARPVHCRWIFHFADRAARDAALDDAQLLVCDANIELVIAAVERNLPTLILPRLAIFGEDYGDVQFRLAQRFSAYRNVRVAEDEADLLAMIDKGAHPADLGEHANDIGVRRSLWRALQMEGAAL